MAQGPGQGLRVKHQGFQPETPCPFTHQATSQLNTLRFRYSDSREQLVTGSRNADGGAFPRRTDSKSAVTCHLRGERSCVNPHLCTQIQAHTPAPSPSCLPSASHEAEASQESVHSHPAEQSTPLMGRFCLCDSKCSIHEDFKRYTARLK